MEQTNKKSKILYCDCKHDFQDSVYGKNKRVHNYAVAANNKSGGYRCTVCANVKRV